MKYFKDKDILLSDFDGVLFDSQKKFNEVMKEETDFDLWYEYLNGINWQLFYKECSEIPDAKKTLKELEQLKILRGFITKIHSLEEGNVKTKILREMGFLVPVYFVLPKQNKSEIIIPNENTILLDDSIYNIDDWNSKNGRGLLYNPNAKRCNKKVINKMSFLLK